MATRRQYSGIAVPTTTVGVLLVAGETVAITVNTGWPSTAAVPFSVVINPDDPTKIEKVLATISGSTLTLTRAQDGTTAREHAAASTIYPVITAVDADEANELAALATTFGKSLLDDANAAAARTTLALGNVDNTSDANKPVSTAQQTALDLKLDDTQATAFGLSLLDDANAAAGRTTLELGSLATQSGTFSGTTSGTNTGDQTTIVGLTGTKAQFNTAVTDGDFLYVGDTPTLSSGGYTPTRSAEVNTTGVAAPTPAQYLRVGSTVTVSGRFTVTAALAAIATSFEITLPVASNLGAVEDLAGVAFCGSISGMGGEIVGVIANDTAKVQWVSSDISSRTWSYQFTYRVI